MVSFEPDTSSGNYLENMVFLPNQTYQTALYMDEQLNRDGVTALRFEHVHANGGPRSYPVVNKGGFGFFWNYGGWNAPGTNFSEGFGHIITQNCGMPADLPSPGAQPYIFTTHQTDSFGTFQVENCRIASRGFGLNLAFNQGLTGNARGQPYQLNTVPHRPLQLT